MLKKLIWLRLTDLINTGGTDVKMDRSVLEGKSSFEMLGLTFSFKLDLSSYIISNAEVASRKIWILDLFYEVSFS